jgi:multidrug efflux pump subunit AcrB
LAVGIAALMLTVGLFKGGYIKSIFMPELEGDMVHGRITMPFGTPPEVTEGHLKRIEAAGRELIAEYDSKMPRGKSILRNVFSVVGGHLRRTSVGGGGGHLGEVSIYLKESDKRNADSEVFARRWRKMVGQIPGAEAVDFTATLMHMGDPIDIQLAHEDFAVLEAAGERLKQALSGFKGLRDITDSHEAGKRELKLKLRPEARALGITQRGLASQVRNAFYGAEAQRIQRGRN